MNLSKEELERRYNNSRNTDLAEELNISIPTLLDIIDKAGIDRKGSGNAYNKDKIIIRG